MAQWTDIQNLMGSIQSQMQTMFASAEFFEISLQLRTKPSQNMQKRSAREDNSDVSKGRVSCKEDHQMEQDSVHPGHCQDCTLTASSTASYRKLTSSPSQNS